MDLIDSALRSDTPESDLFRPKIAVCGVGGGGSNTVQRMSKSGISGAKLIALNTDGTHLNTMDPSIRRILIGKQLTRGMGAGGFPMMGAKAAEQSRGEIEQEVADSNLVFITAGMGGGTGSGAAPIVGRISKDAGALVIGIVTYPFAMERIRLKTAQQAIEELKKNVDTLIVIDNQKLFEVYKNLAMEQAFKVADEVAVRAVKGITETINSTGLINVDYADIRAVMRDGGIAMISVGEGSGPDRVEEVVKNTLRNKLLDVDYDGTTGVMLYIKGGEDLTLGDANLIATKLTEQVAPNANVIWGAGIDPAMNGRVEVVGIFTGVKSSQMFGPQLGSDAKSGGFGIDEM